MRRVEGWVENVFKDPTPQSARYFSVINESITHRRLNRILVARWRIFRAFLEAASEHYGPDLCSDIKHQWLMFQILPIVRVNNMDPFTAFFKACLSGAGESVIYSLNTITLEKVLGHHYNPSNDKFFFVLDEAQALEIKPLHRFADAAGVSSRPVLSPIIQNLTGREGKVIVSGTSFSLESFNTVLASRVGKSSWDSDWSIEYVTGDFMDQVTQEAYLKRFLPPSYLCSPSGVSLVKRSFEWLRGRYVEKSYHESYVIYYYTDTASRHALSRSF
jgi:hypothetical protein